jgi:NTP pyrophosphatase (non-canonical NTP hydrolase)
MDVKEYRESAMVTVNRNLDKRDMLINGAMGLCGESGEVIDILKKHIFHGHELDREHLIEELGDVAWYLNEAAYALDSSLEEIFDRNIAKLKKRYPQGFDKERSINREK